MLRRATARLVSAVPETQARVPESSEEGVRLGVAAGRAGAALVLHGREPLVEELHQLAGRVRVEEEGVDGVRLTREARHQGRVPPRADRPPRQRAHALQP